MAHSNDAEEQARDLRASLSNFSSRDKRVEFALTSLAWATPLIIGVNTLAFIAMAVTSATVLGFSPIQLVVWGGNSAVLDLAGQWWRLLTYQFLHANLLHIAINMWVLWNVGRLTERLYGSITLLFLYLASGILAGFTSIVWNPELVSVGASGSIFGILGAFLAFLVRFRNEAPPSVLRYWIPALVFAAYNLFAGAYQPGVDNAAHVGGLIGGFLLGLMLARELGEARAFSFTSILSAILFVCAVALPPLWYLGAFDRSPSAQEAFAQTHPWYMEGEAKNLQLWQSLAVQMGSGAISSNDVANNFEQNIIPFWQNANDRLQSELAQPNRDQSPFLLQVAQFAQIRLRWARAISSTLRNGGQLDTETMESYVQQTIRIQSEIDRSKLRGVAETMPVPLNQSAIAIWLRRQLPELGPACVVPPAYVEKPLSAADAAYDGPAQRHAIGCAAQKMFLMGDYQTLDDTIKFYARTPSDLPDGSSRLEGVWSGLDDLFSYGQVPVEEAMRRLAQWRRAVKGSAEPDLVETLMFRIWAYSARGHGPASDVSAQAMQTFSARTFMAAASLRDAAPAGAYNPVWYSLAIGLDRDQSVPWQTQELVFDLGAKHSRDYLPLYRQILTSLMPRWDGSIEAVDDFIRSASTKSGQMDPALYARLYLIYGNLEGDDFNVVESAHADSQLIKEGMAALRIRYPHSDYILNTTARFTCIDRDWDLYRSLSARLPNHISTQAWPDKLSATRCDALSR